MFTMKIQIPVAEFEQRKVSTYINDHVFQVAFDHGDWHGIFRKVIKYAGYIYIYYLLI